LKRVIVILLALYTCLTAISQSNLSNIDSLEQLMELKTDTAKVNLMLLIGNQYQFVDTKVSEFYYQRALKLSDSLSYTEGKAKSLRNLAELKLSTSDYTKSYSYFNEALKVFKSIDNIEGIASCYLNLSIINNRVANYPSALEQASNALILFRQINNFEGMGLSYNNLGNIYDDMGNFKQSLHYYEKALEIYSNTKNKSGLARVYINISIIYNKTNKYNDAGNLLEKAIDIAKEINDNRVIAIAYGNLGLMFENSGQINRALEYYEKSLEIKNNLGDRHSIMISNMNIANAYLKLNRTDLALKHINFATGIGLELGAKRELMDAYEIQAKIFEKRADYKNAFYALNNKMLLNDSVFGNKQIRYLINADLKNEIRQLENENQILRQQSIIDQLKIENNRFTRYYLAIGLIFALVLIGLLVYQSNERRNNARKLDDVNKTLLKTNKQLKRSEAALVESNQAKDKFFSIISHDLRNPLASMVSFVRIMKRDYSTLDKNEQDALIDEFEKIVNRTGNLLENLLMWSRSQTGRLNITPEKFNASNILKENAEFHETMLAAKEIKILLSAENETSEVFADKNMINTVLRNLISNAIKFTQPGGKIEIGFNLSGKFCIFFVKDNGIGIEADKLANLFSLGEVNVRTGTANEKGSGLGLVLCKEFVEKNGGQIWPESKVNEGTSFYFSVPLSS